MGAETLRGRPTGQPPFHSTVQMRVDDGLTTQADAFCATCHHPYSDHATDAEREHAQVEERPCLWAFASSICPCEDFVAEEVAQMLYLEEIKHRVGRNHLGWQYAVTSHNGAGVYAQYKTFAQAKDAAINKWAYESLTPLEIERVWRGEIGYQYWMRRGKRWVHWNAHEDAAVRKPDFLVEPRKAGAR